jgi:hypothetical protein
MVPAVLRADFMVLEVLHNRRPRTLIVTHLSFLILVFKLIRIHNHQVVALNNIALVGASLLV